MFNDTAIAQALRTYVMQTAQVLVRAGAESVAERAGGRTRLDKLRGVDEK